MENEANELKSLNSLQHHLIHEQRKNMDFLIINRLLNTKNKIFGSKGGQLNQEPHQNNQDYGINLENTKKKLSSFDTLKETPKKIINNPTPPKTNMSPMINPPIKVSSSSQKAKNTTVVSPFPLAKMPTSSTNTSIPIKNSSNKEKKTRFKEDDLSSIELEKSENSKNKENEEDLMYFDSE